MKITKEITVEKKALLLDLYRIAWIDGELTNEEQLIINKICFDNGISFDDLAKVLKGKNSKKEYPTEETEKRKYLFEIARLIIADGKIREEEIFLFDKISKAFGYDNTSKEIIKKEIFELIITAYFENEQKRLNNLKKQLNEEYEKLISKKQQKFILESEHKKIIEELKKGWAEGIYSAGFVKKPRIILFGQFKQSEQKLKEIITKILKQNNIIFDNKCIKFCIGDYDKIKRQYSNCKTSIENGSYDLFLYGPHHHHLNGKSNEESWEKYLKSTNTVVYGDYNKQMSQESIKKIVRKFVENWN
jgi:hypothetical protein